MRAFVWTTLLLLLGLCRNASGSLDRLCTLEDRKNHVYMCGSLWADTLSMLCHPWGHAPGKRSSPNSDLLATTDKPLSNDLEPYVNSLKKPYFLPKTKALSYIKTIAKREWQTVGEQNVFWGAACECCHNRCSFQEMAQYCLNPEGALEKWGLGNS